VETKKISGPVLPPNKPGDPDDEEITLAITVTTPFKFTGIFETKYGAQGTVFVRHYAIDRGGFQSPIEISLADRQVRHLQGVTTGQIVVPPSVSELDYPINLSTFLEIGRTSRTTLMAVGVVAEPDGTRHKVSYSSGAQDDQIIVLAVPARLSIRTGRKSLSTRSGGVVSLLVSVNRGTALSGPVTVQLLVPRHMRGISAEEIVIAANENQDMLTLRFAEGRFGPFNMPLTLRARMMDDRGYPVLSDTTFDVVAIKRSRRTQKP